jgi:hypothetical protein
MRKLIVLFILAVTLLFSQDKITAGVTAEPIQLTTLFPFVNRLNQKIGYMNSDGKIVISPQFDQSCAGPNAGNCIVNSLLDAGFSEGLAKIRTGGRYGFIDEKGQVKIKPEYENAGKFSGGVAWVKSKDKYGYIDMLGNLKIPISFQSASDFSEGVARVRLNGKYGYIDHNGKMVIEPQFTEAGNFSNGLVAIRVDFKYGYFDRQLKMIIPPRFESAGDFSEGLASVAVRNDQLGLRYGYINDRGSFVLKPTYESAENFSDGLAAVRDEGKYYYIDPTGKKVLKVPEGYPHPFKNGLALISLGSEILQRRVSDGPRGSCQGLGSFTSKLRFKAGYINKSGQTIYEGTTIVYHNCAPGIARDLETYNEAPLVDVSIDSKPTSAVLYLIPKWDWEHTPAICTKIGQYPMGNTIYSQRIVADTYMLVFEYGGKRYTRAQDFERSLKNQITVDLSNEAKCP